MAVQNWWKYQTLTEARQRQLAKFDAVTQAAGQRLLQGDVAGAKQVLAVNSSRAEKAKQQQKKNFRDQLRKRWDIQPGGSSIVGKAAGAVGKAAADAGKTAWEHTPANVRASLERTGSTAQQIAAQAAVPFAVADKVSSKFHLPGHEDTSVADRAQGFVSGQKNLENLGFDTGYIDRLRQKGWGGRVAAAAIDTAAAPVTYMPGLGIGSKIAERGAGPMARILAARWGGEVTAGVAAQLASEEAGKYVAGKTDNPWLVGGAATAAGLVAGAAGYGAGYKAVEKGPGAAKALEDAAAAKLATNFPELASGEAGTSIILRPGDKLLHGTVADFDELRASSQGVQGSGAYVTHGEDAALAGENAASYSGTDVPGSRTFLTTPAKPLKSLIWDEPVQPEELKALRSNLSREEQAVFDDVVKSVTSDGKELTGATARYAVEVAKGDEAKAIIDRVNALPREEWLARAEKEGYPNHGALLDNLVDKVFEKAGFDASTKYLRNGVAETAVRDPKNLRPLYAEDLLKLPEKPGDATAAFDRQAALEAAQKYLDNARNANGGKAGLPPGVNTAEDIVTLQEGLFRTAQEGAHGRFWYERSGKAVLKMFNGDVDQAEKFLQLIAIYSPSREINPNFDLALRAWNQFKNGDPITVGSRQQWDTATKVMNGIPWKGRKTGNFYGNMLGYVDPERAAKDELLSKVTADRHMGTAYGFPTTSDGSVAIGKGPRYDFIESQTQELARQLGWTPEQTQAAIWVVEKARKSKGRISVDAAAADFADSLETTWGQVSWEAAPGVNTGYMPGYHNALEPEKMEWFVAHDKAMVDDNGVDILAREMGIISPGRDIVQGAYKNSAGEMEFNPSGQTRVAAGPALKSTSISPLERAKKNLTWTEGRGKNQVTYTTKKGMLGPILEVDKETGRLRPKAKGYTIPGNEYALEPAVSTALDAYAAAKGLLLHQEAVGWTKPVAVRAAADGDGIAITIGRTLTKDETAALVEALGPDVIPVGTAEGSWFLNAPWSGVDNESFHNTVAKVFGDIIPEDFHSEVFKNGGSYVEVGANGQGALKILDDSGYREAFERARAILQPRLDAIRDDFIARYGWDKPGPTPGSVWSDAAGQAGVRTAVTAAGGAAGAAYGYATGEDPKERWKRALAFGLGGAAVAAGAQAGAHLFNPKVTPSPAPPRPTSVLSSLPSSLVERDYVNASGLRRIVPKVGTGAIQDAVAVKKMALKLNSRVFESLPPVFKNGIAYLNPSKTMDQDVLVAWRAGLGTRGQLQTAWQTAVRPKVEAVEQLLSGATYKGPTGTAADAIIGTAKDIAENPELYDITPQLRQALDDLNISMWDDVSAQARANYGVEVLPFEGDRKAGFTYLPTVEAKGGLDEKLDAAFSSLSTKQSAKRRGYTTARQRMIENPDFVPETDLRALVDIHVQAMASNAGHSVLKNAAGGKSLGDVLDELHPGLREAKQRTRGFITNLNSRVKTATANKAEQLRKVQLNDTQMRQLETRMKPIEARVAELEADDVFGPELSYLSGQLRELRMMHGKLATYSKTLEGRVNFKNTQLKSLSDAIDSAQGAFDDLLRRYQSAGTGDYTFEKLTNKWYTPEAAKTVQGLLKVPDGFSKQMAALSDEIRAWHLAGDASLGTIQGGLGVFSDPVNAAKMARKMMGARPTEELARIAQAEADDVAEYTFATGRSFDSPLAEIRLEKRGVERIPGVKAAQDELSALFSRGSYEAWKHERDILLTQNPGLDRRLAGEEAANMLSKVVPGLNPADRGISQARGAFERGVATSVSFASAPALVGAEAAKGTAQLTKQAFYRLSRSANANPEGLWAALSPREQIAVRRAIVGSSTVMALAAGSAIISAPSRNMSVEDAVRETFDTNSRYFMAFQLGDGRSIPLGGPFRSAIKAVVPDHNGVMFGNLPSFVGTRVNSPYKPAFDLYRNKDFYGDDIYSGNVARPENLARALWYAADQGFAPVSVGQLSQDVRKGQLDPIDTPTGVLAQFLGTNLTPVSPTERLNQISRARFGKDFYDLLPKDQASIKKGNPKLWDEAVKAGSAERQAAEAKKKEVNDQQAADDQLLLQGKLTVQKWTSGADDRSNQVVGANDVLFKDSKSKGKTDPVLEEYYQRIQDSAAQNNGRVDWDVVGAWRDALPKSKQQVIDQNTGLNKTPLARLRSDLTQEYYSLPRYRGYTADQASQIDDLWQEVRNNSRSTSDAAMLATLSRMSAGVDQVILTGVRRRILGLLRDSSERGKWAQAHPESAIFLRRGNLTKQDADAINKALSAYR